MRTKCSINLHSPRRRKATNLAKGKLSIHTNHKYCQAYYFPFFSPFPTTIGFPISDLKSSHFPLNDPGPVLPFGETTVNNEPLLLFVPRVSPHLLTFSYDCVLLSTCSVCFVGLLWVSSVCLCLLLVAVFFVCLLF